MFWTGLGIYSAKYFDDLVLISNMTEEFTWWHTVAS